MQLYELLNTVPQWGLGSYPASRGSTTGRPAGSPLTSRGRPSCSGRVACNKDTQVTPMADTTDEQRRALRPLARHRDGCPETILFEQGFSYDQLADVVFNVEAENRGPP
jgi:hypothetical protein